MFQIHDCVLNSCLDWNSFFQGTNVYVDSSSHTHLDGVLMDLANDDDDDDDDEDDDDDDEDDDDDGDDDDDDDHDDDEDGDD